MISSKKRALAAREDDSSDSDTELTASSIEEQTTGSEVDNDSESEHDSALGDDSSDGESDDSELDQSKTAGSDSFSAAVEAILGSKLKAHDREVPILVRNKTTARKIEEAKLDARARRLLRKERQELKDKARVREVIPSNIEAAEAVMQREKRLKRTAQRGVIKLFNAIYASQNSAAESKQGLIGIDKREKQAAEISKEKFLEMIKSG